jgi:hypothetical protein
MPNTYMVVTLRILTSRLLLDRQFVLDIGGSTGHRISGGRTI